MALVVFVGKLVAVVEPSASVEELAVIVESSASVEALFVVVERLHEAGQPAS